MESKGLIWKMNASLTQPPPPSAASPSPTNPKGERRMLTSINNALPAMVSATVAAAMVGVSPCTIAKYVHTHQFPKPRWIGNRTLYPVDEINKWLLSDKRFLSNRPTGEDHPNCKWPKEFVALAITLSAKGASINNIATRLKVPKSTVHKWVNGARRSQNPDDVKVRAKAAAKSARTKKI